MDILVNNAGFAHKGNVFGAEEAQYVLNVNYRGTKHVTEALLPLLRKSVAGARVVCVCSMAGKLRIVGEKLRVGADTDQGCILYYKDATLLRTICTTCLWIFQTF